MSDAYKLNGKTWASRIVGHDVVQPDQPLANPMNARIHGKLQQDATAGNLGALGWVKSVVVNRQTGHVVDGHLRVTLALRNGSPVPVEYVDLTEAEEAQALATLDPLTELATYDAELLTALLAQVNTDDAALQEVFNELNENAEMLREAEIGEPGSSDRQMGDKRKQIKPVLYADEVYDFERAILATGERNRGAAFLEICRFFLEHSEKGQQHALFESILAPELAGESA